MSNCYESDSFIFFCPFFQGVLGAALLLFPSGFLCAFLFVFSVLFGLFWVPGDQGGGGAEAYDSGLGANYRRERLMTADGGLITAAGEACDSGREAHYWGGKGL